MRKRSLETFQDSAKRNADEQQGARPKKSRASGANTLAYMKDRAEVEATLKRDELEIKRQELALQAKEQEGRQQQFDMMNKQTRDIQQLQQQQMQQFMQMNANMMQQQTLALMELMKKFADKWCWSIYARGHLNAQRVYIFINLGTFLRKLKIKDF